ncbi:MAG: hypothetical protein IJ780_06090 [Neisseriaceae bacterium]|nr:hypothetical protein [Neisseriaceae bacterium]
MSSFLVATKNRLWKIDGFFVSGSLKNKKRQPETAVFFNTNQALLT